MDDKRWLNESIIYLHGIHSGGGLTLLAEIIRIAGADKRYYFILDERIRSALTFEVTKNIIFFPSGLFGRIRSELHVWKKVNKSKVVLSMNSMPFIFPIRCRQRIFFQNVNLLFSNDSIDFAGMLRKLTFKLCSRRVEKFFVQTSTVKNLLLDETENPVEIISILDACTLTTFSKAKSIKSNQFHPNLFVYIADSSPHKNHCALIDAWQLLHKTFPGFNSRLILTIPFGEGSIWNSIKFSINVDELSISNYGTVDRGEIFALYKQANALVYPSVRESFGLPLIEARSFDCDIIAAELDYVRDVCDPAETFDPKSSLSIARAIARYLGYSWPASVNPVEVKDFLDHCFSE